MVQKKKKSYGLYTINLDVMSKVLWIVVMAFGVVAFGMIFGPALITQTEEAHSGLQVTFGEIWFDAGYVRQYIPFSILAFMGFFFPLFASGVMALNMGKENKWYDIACAALFFISFILVILIPKYVVFVKTNTITETSTKALVDGILGWASQLTVFFSFGGCIASLLKWFSDTYQK